MAKLFLFILILSLLSLAAHAYIPYGTHMPMPKPISIPKPKPVFPLSSMGSCGTLKLGTCVDVLGLVDVVIGTPPTNGCCPLLDGLVDLEAAVCLCLAIKANVLGINLDVPVALNVILSSCQKTVPEGFQCA